MSGRVTGVPKHPESLPPWMLFGILVINVLVGQPAIARFGVLYGGVVVVMTIVIRGAAAHPAPSPGRRR